MPNWVRQWLVGSAVGLLLLYGIRPVTLGLRWTIESAPALILEGDDLMNEFWAALAGAVVGSLMSGVISYLLQRSSFEQQKQEREEREKMEKRAMGHSLFFKALSIVKPPAY